MNRRHVFLLLLAAFLAGAFAYLFRTETQDHPDFGLMEYQFRWGYLSEERIDVNRDGIVDSRAIFDMRDARFGDRDLPVSEFWEDRDSDGELEVHAFLDRETVTRVEIDEDKDGRPDEVLVGKEASDYFLRFVPKKEDD
ncbi:MAG: hypothetical protein GY722_28280 [bacterium]|nr:hypothetical protein [bacterium]